MTIRKVEVEFTSTIVMEFDDEVVSDWDGRTLLTCHENPERFTPGSTLRTSLAGAAVSIGLWGSHDGWADFPREAISADMSWEFPEIESVYLDGVLIR